LARLDILSMEEEEGSKGCGCSMSTWWGRKWMWDIGNGRVEVLG